MNLRIQLVLMALLLSDGATLYAEPCSSPRAVEILAPGLTHLSICRGEVASSTGYRVLIGSFDRQSAADRALDRLEEMGLSVLPTTDGEDYRIVSPTFSERSRAEEIEQRLHAEGFDSSHSVEEVHQDLTNAGGPWRIHVLEAAPKAVEIRVAHALDATIGIETTTALASRHGAIAAVNGGYYRMTGLLAGEAQGVLKIDGVLLSEPERGRAASGYFEVDGLTHSVFGRLSFRAEILLEDGGSVALDGLNRNRGPDEILLYSPEFHRTTLTARDGAEIVVRDDRIVAVRKGAGSTEIPPHGFVISLGRNRIDEVLPRLRLHQRVSLNTEILPLLPDPAHEWEKAEFILGGGPLLLWNGKRVEEPGKESISRVFFHARHPRTAVGKRADGTLLLVTVDGRQPQESVGMSLSELTDLLLELGAVFAVNLDGGGSTTMTIRDRTVNLPSSSGGDRANGDALLLFSRHLP